jgi:transcriptional regulator with XRE-family HTH domain
MSKSPERVDIEVGKRIRTYRVLKSQSQTTLGAAAGITFQQIQKYEKGANRVPPSRLQKISDFLDVPIADFYPSMDKGNGKKGSGNATAPFVGLLQSKNAMQLLSHYTAVRSPGIRAALVGLVAALAHPHEEEE